MTEKSIMWTTGATGDGATAYTQAEVIRWLRQTFIGDDTNEGVCKNYLNELEVTGVASPVAVNTGAAYVYGFPYWNTASVNVAIPTPSSNTRIDRIVLEADWTAQTVRITRVAGTEGAGAPSLTQTDGVTWQIPLAQASITTGGVITVTDERVFVHPNIEIESGMIADSIADASTIEVSSGQLRIKDNGVTAAKIANRTRRFLVQAVGGRNITDGTDIVYYNIGVPLPDAKSATGYGGFMVLDDFASGMTIKAVLRPLATGNVYIELNQAEYGADGESRQTHQDYDGPDIVAITSPNNNAVEPVSLSSAAKGDFVALTFWRNGTSPSDTIGNTVYLVGWLVEYTADS